MAMPMVLHIADILGLSKEGPHKFYLDSFNYFFHYVMLLLQRAQLTTEMGRQNTQHDDTQHNDTQHSWFVCDPRHELHSAQQQTVISAIMLMVAVFYCCTE